MTCTLSRLNVLIVPACANAAVLLVILVSAIGLDVKLHQLNAKLAAVNAKLAAFNSQFTDRGSTWPSSAR